MVRNFPRNESARKAPKSEVKYDRNTKAWYRMVDRFSALASVMLDWVLNKCLRYRAKMAGKSPRRLVSLHCYILMAVIRLKNFSSKCATKKVIFQKKPEKAFAIYQANSFLSRSNRTNMF